ncbi:MAG: fumarylacetoacetate hydrolase family protein [Verrucomicrobiota bacterium]
MKLIRFGEPGQEKPGLEIKDARYDVSNLVRDYNEFFFAKDGIAKLATDFNKGNASEISQDVRLGPPIARPSKLICIGLNYHKHAEELGMEAPKEPVVFFKSTTAITGPYDNVMIPRGGEKTDWEVELAIVIAKTARYISKDKAMDHIAGYTLHNDVSERAFQLERCGQWVKGKSCDTFAPLGPCLVTKDEVPDPHNLNIWLSLNGQTMQNNNTKDMIFDVPTLVSYLSEFMTLLPGDVISTGTPEGVGFGFDPPVYLRPNDIMELGIDRLGTSKQKVAAFRPQSYGNGTEMHRYK